MKNYFEKQRITKTINKINKIKKECAINHIYEVRMPLERISSSLSNNVVKYTFKKSRKVNECLERISSHLSNDFTKLIQNECFKANSIIADTYTPPTKEEQCIIEDEEKINELEKKLRYVDSRMQEVNKQMDDSLGKDKITWKRLNKEKNFLINESRIINQAFDSMLTHTHNLKTAEMVRELRGRYSSLVASQQPSVDMDEFDDNCEMNKYVHEETRNQDKMISEKIYNTCNNVDEDDESYLQALESKLTNAKSLNKEPIEAVSDPTLSLVAKV